MFEKIEKSKKNKVRSNSRAIPYRNDNPKQRVGLTDNRHDLSLSEQGVADNVIKSGDIIQKQHKNILSPNDEQVRLMDMLNQRNHAIVKKYKMESKGTHGTNWMHAISIMQGIKYNIPKEMRTSDVTPEEGGFFVDISESGQAQSHDFAKMAAYGTQEEATPPHYTDSSQKEKEFKDHVNAGKGTRRAIILEIWGQKNATPEPRKSHQQSDEDIYRTNAHLLVATLKDSL